MKYIFILGRNPALSIAELYAKFPETRFEYLCPEAMIIDSQEPFDGKRLMHELGGTIKIGEYIGESDSVEIEDFVFEYLENSAAGKKIFFGISLYGKNPNGVNARALGGELKTRLKVAGIRARWVVSSEPILSSVVVARNKLLTRGAEFLLIPNKNKIAIGRTLAVQEFEDLSYRDFGRPAREMEVGLMPPKVARIMLNMAGVSKSAKILDPFCGFGTVATEAMIMGYKNIYASDLEEAMISGAKKNIEWVKRFFPETVAAEVKVFPSPAEKVSAHFKKREIDAIVTEPYLGPIQRNVLDEVAAQKRAGELGKIYVESLRDWEKMLKPGGRVVMIFPSFQTRSGFVSIPVAEELKKLPYDILPPLPDEATRLPYIKITPQGGLIYERPGQKVRREVFVLRLTK